MSVSIGWYPAKRESLEYVDGGSSAVTALENAFGEMPITLNSTDIPKLEGISACGFYGVEDLIVALYKHTSIVVKKQY